MTINRPFLCACLASILILYICIRLVRRQDESIGKTVINILTIEITAALANVLAIISPNYSLAAFGYGAYYASMTWLCYFMVQYTCEYTKVKSHFLWVDSLWKILLVLDSVSLLLNAFLGHVATFRLVGTGRNAYMVIQPKFLYTVHLVFCGMMVTEVLIRLILAIIKSPSLYRLQYLSLLLIFCIIVAADAFFYYAKDLLDLSILFFASGSTILVYASFYFIPAIFRNQMFTMVFREMEDSIVMFDNKGNCVYLNNKWEQNDNVKNMKQSQFDALLKSSHDETGAICMLFGNERRIYEDRFDVLRDAHGQYIGCYYIFRDITVEKELLRTQKYLANHDVLTGIYNRNTFLLHSEDLLKKFPNEEFLIVCSDIKQFKLVNEVFGIQIGDKLLKLVADVFASYRDSKSVYGKLESDSFVLCIPEKNFDIDLFVQRLNDAIATLAINYSIINHIGIYRVDDRTLSLSAMCDRAMLAVNSIKTDYEKAVVYYDDSLREQLLNEQKILQDLEHAFKENQFVIYLQPQFNYETKKITGAEALVRWIHPEKGVIPPNVFIPLLENNGLISKLNVRVWELACMQLHKWKMEGKEVIPISVNISTKDFFYVDIYDILTKLIHKYDISISNIKLEITESAFTIDLAKQLIMIEKLQNAGFVIEMDDFGSGYSSLNSLKDIPVDVLKMDMAFMSKSDPYHRSADILQMVVAMADKLNMPVIAEGVETKEQADFLNEIGCHIIQGYYYAKPMPISQFEEMVYK